MRELRLERRIDVCVPADRIVQLLALFIVEPWRTLVGCRLRAPQPAEPAVLCRLRRRLLDALAAQL